MQTSLAISQFGPTDQHIAASLLPRVLDQVNSEPVGRSKVAAVQFVPPVKERRLVNCEKVEASISYMTQNLDRPLQVSTLASLVNISPSHYFALFKRHTGRAPIDYFTRLRMEKARSLLETTELSVKEVAAALGYDDPFYFSRVFKSVNQLAPSNYRVKQRARADLAENPPCES